MAETLTFRSPKPRVSVETGEAIQLSERNERIRVSALGLIFGKVTSPNEKPRVSGNVESGFQSLGQRGGVRGSERGIFGTRSLFSVPLLPQLLMGLTREGS